MLAWATRRREARSDARQSLAAALERLGPAWTVLSEAQVGRFTFAHVLLHRSCGVVLIGAGEGTPGAANAAIAGFRRFLSEGEFEAFFPGYLPVIHLPAELAASGDLAAVIVDSFAKQSLLSIRDESWAASLAGVIAGTDTAAQPAPPSPERARDERRAAPAAPAPPAAEKKRRERRAPETASFAPSSSKAPEQPAAPPPRAREERRSAPVDPAPPATGFQRQEARVPEVAPDPREAVEHRAASIPANRDGDERRATEDASPTPPAPEIKRQELRASPASAIAPSAVAREPPTPQPVDDAGNERPAAAPSPAMEIKLQNWRAAAAAALRSAPSEAASPGEASFRVVRHPRVETPPPPHFDAPPADEPLRLSSEPFRLSVDPGARLLSSRRDRRVSTVTLLFALAVAGAAFLLRHEWPQHAPASAVEEAAVAPPAAPKPVETLPAPVTAAPSPPPSVTADAVPKPAPPTDVASTGEKPVTALPSPAPRTDVASTGEKPATVPPSPAPVTDVASANEKPATAPPEQPIPVKAQPRTPRRLARASPPSDQTTLGNGPPIDAGDLPPLPSSGD
jgi:hypothetical protein